MAIRRVTWALLLAAGAGLAAGVLGCAKAKPPWEGLGGPPRVLVTIPPLYSFVKSVGGDHVGVLCLCTATGPHSYEGTTRDALLLREADLFLASGLGLEKFTEKIRINSGTERFRFVELGDDLLKQKPKLVLKMREEHEEGKGHEHEHGEWDPHIWLGIPQARALVQEIARQLGEVDAAHKADYENNAAAYVKRLDDLRAEGKKLLAGKKDKRIIAFHDSFQYFADSFGLEILDVIEEGPGAEPTDKKMVDLVNLVVQKDIRVITVEPQYPEAKAQVLLDELKKKNKTEVKLVKIDPLETADEKDLSADWYTERLLENLKALAEALP
jgi:zinc transport system substrate-binding protein